MAAFRKRSNGWQVRVRRKGYPEVNKTFPTRKEAEFWARLIESEMDKGAFVNRVEADNTTLAELLTRYLKEITPQKKHPSIEAYRIKTWLKTSLAQRFISNIRSADYAARRDERIKDGMSPSSIKLEFAIISHMYFVARAEWGFDGLENPIRYLRMPKLPKGRTRRVSDEELELVTQHTDSFDLPYILKIAIETGMRRGEIAKLTWKDVDMTKRTAHLA